MLEFCITKNQDFSVLMHHCLPQSYATAEVKGNFYGNSQEFAHTRLYA